MITAEPHNYYAKADGSAKDCSLGNVLFTIAGIIGVAVKNNYNYGFKSWVNQEYFVNPLPLIDSTQFKPFQNPITYAGFDLGFCGFNIPDNVIVNGYFGSYKYFEHCTALIKHYFTMKVFNRASFKDHIVIQYRNYNPLSGFYPLDHNYYEEALSLLPNKKIVVVTDNIDAARKATKLKCEYISSSPILDFSLLSHANYLIMANSTFSWWGAFLSGAETVAPKYWFDPNGAMGDCPIGNNDLYLKEWRVV
jgi:hypothetical protein